MTSNPMFWYCDCPAGIDMQLWRIEQCPRCGATREGRTSRSARRHAVWKEQRAKRQAEQIAARPVVAPTRAVAIEF